MWNCGGTHYFQVIECDVYVQPSLFMCGYSGQQCCVKDVSWKASVPRKKSGRTYTHTHNYLCLLASNKQQNNQMERSHYKFPIKMQLPICFYIMKPKFRAYLALFPLSRCMGHYAID